MPAIWNAELFASQQLENGLNKKRFVCACLWVPRARRGGPCAGTSVRRCRPCAGQGRLQLHLLNVSFFFGGTSVNAELACANCLHRDNRGRYLPFVISVRGTAEGLRGPRIGQ